MAEEDEGVKRIGEKGDQDLVKMKYFRILFSVPVSQRAAEPSGVFKITLL